MPLLLQAQQADGWVPPVAQPAAGTGHHSSAGGTEGSRIDPERDALQWSWTRCNLSQDNIIEDVVSDVAQAFI